MNVKSKSIKSGVKKLLNILTSSESRIEDSFRCDSLMACANILNMSSEEMLEEIDSFGTPSTIESVLSYLDTVFGTKTFADTFVDYVEETGEDASEVLDVVSEVWPAAEIGSLTGLITRDWNGE